VDCRRNFFCKENFQEKILSLFLSLSLPLNKCCQQDLLAKTIENMERDTTCTLWFEGISLFDTEKTMRNEFVRFGDVASVNIIRDKNGQSLCYGFVTFIEEEAAQAAFERLNGSKWLNEYGDRTNVLKLEFAHTDARVRNRLHVGGLSADVTVDMLRQIFEKECGEVLYCSVAPARDWRTGKTRSTTFGFVEFSKKGQAMKAVELFTGFEWMDHVLSVSYARNTMNPRRQGYRSNDNRPPPLETPRRRVNTVNGTH
jgi:RNA recognition motif-containing protein